MDGLRNFHTKWSKSEKKKNILRYYVQVESINSYQWTNVQKRNELTVCENQILIIKRKLKGRDK